MRHESGGCSCLARIFTEKSSGEAYLDFPVRVAEGVELHPLIVGLDGQVTSLIEHRQGVVGEFRRHVKIGLGNQRDVVQCGFVNRVTPQPFYKVGRRAGIKPVAADTTVTQGIKQAERIVDILGPIAEMIAVVVIFQQFQSFFVGNLLPVGKRLHTILNIVLQLLLRNTANRRVFSLHRNILQIVQLAEYAELGELVDPGDEYKPQIRVKTLYRAVEIPHYLPQGRKPDLVVHHIQQRCVIFINDQHCWFPGLGERLFYQKLQPCVDIHLVQILTFAINSFIFSKFIVELAQQLILVHVLGRGHIEMEDRVPLPFFLLLSGL